MTTYDDDRTARSQITLRLDRTLVEAIDELASEQGIDRTEVTRRLLADGLARRRIELALGDYAEGRRSAWSAAERAGVDLYTMLDRIAEGGIPYRIDPEALDRLRMPEDSSGPRDPQDSLVDATDSAISALRVRFRPSSVRLLFVGESSPAGGTHFYQADSILYRATREAFGLGLHVSNPPDGTAFLDWFRDLGCWLVDLADRPINREEAGPRARAVEAGIPALTELIRATQPARILVVLRSIAAAVRKAATAAGVDVGSIDVLPFPVRQWRAPFVTQLAGIVSDELGRVVAEPTPAATAVAETGAAYGSPLLHDIMADVLRAHGRWMKAAEIASEIASGDRWRRPSDGRHPRGSQISARARQYPRLFQVSDLGIRLRE